MSISRTCTCKTRLRSCPVTLTSHLAYIVSKRLIHRAHGGEALSASPPCTAASSMKNIRHGLNFFKVKERFCSSVLLAKQKMTDGISRGRLCLLQVDPSEANSREAGRKAKICCLKTLYRTCKFTPVIRLSHTVATRS